MKRLWMILVCLCLLITPVHGIEYTAPPVPDSGADIMPPDPESFGEGLFYIVSQALKSLYPELAACTAACAQLAAAVLILSVLTAFSEHAANTAGLVGGMAVSALLLTPSNTLIRLGAETVTEIAEYEKLLLPVMTASLAAQGGITSSAALYTGTAVFNAVLSGMIAHILIPLIYVFLAFSAAHCAVGEEMLQHIRNFVKWLITWSLKILLYVFTGYLAITGVVSGAADAAALKATRLTISGAVPVVGGILSDASEAVLVGAGLMRSAAGVYGLLAVTAVWIGPFLKIGVQYLLLKMTGSICGIFDCKNIVQLIRDFASAMGLILGMTGTVCLLMLISTVCFMKGAAS